jgi:hypothetical protein
MAIGIPTHDHDVAEYATTSMTTPVSYHDATREGNGFSTDSAAAGIRKPQNETAKTTIRLPNCNANDIARKRAAIALLAKVDKRLLPGDHLGPKMKRNASKGSGRRVVDHILRSLDFLRVLGHHGL